MWLLSGKVIVALVWAFWMIAVDSTAEGYPPNKQLIPEKEEIKQEIALKSSEESRFEELNYGLSVEDSIIYLNGEIDEMTVLEVIGKFRTIINNRESDQSKDPINLIVDSPGGCAYSMFGIIDYIENLDVKVVVVLCAFAFDNPILEVNLINAVLALVFSSDTADTL